MGRASRETFPGDPANVKLTHPQDFDRSQGAPLHVRVATGYDVHAFGDGDHVWLGGVRIAHDRGVLAHSDGDVALHALTDALLGALAEGDIGTHFPPSDPQWKGAASAQFLAFAAGRVRQRGGRIDFLDLTIVCEAPKVGPHREAIRAAIAAAAEIRIDQVAIKATTSERMGFTGRGEGLAALATARSACRNRSKAMFDTEITKLATEVLDACRKAGLTVATVESCTGGLIAGALTAIPGSSDVVNGGLVTYSNAAKSALAGVPAELIEAHGAVSEPVARAMAEGGWMRLAANLRHCRHRRRRPRRRQCGQASGVGPFRLRPRPCDGSSRTAFRSSVARRDSPSIDHIRAALEGLGEFAESLVEHRAHQQAEHAAGEFVGDEEADLTAALDRLEGPAVLQIAERPIDIFDQDLEIGRVERDAAGEGFADRLVADAHIGEQNLAAALAWRPLAHRQPLAKRQELRIFLDIGDEREHLLGRVPHPAGC
jgi:2-C-methyl-D-erythritol 2,4-cyclodiphosphate synthase